mmetsp:Transcript_34586/g.69881  ORF Transcript_34586/g.69881 Transcript_34586/m.69881 type:complete len:189 (+) Transcript_34586:259-825(+)
MPCVADTRIGDLIIPSNMATSSAESRSNAQVMSIFNRYVEGGGVSTSTCTGEKGSDDLGEFDMARQEADATDDIRFCKSIGELRPHLISHESSTGKGKCKCCGENTLTRCKMCKVPRSAALWHTALKGDKAGNLLGVLSTTTTEYFGLAYCDRNLRGIAADDWKAPTTEHKHIENAEHIRRLMRYHVD